MPSMIAKGNVKAVKTHEGDVFTQRYESAVAIYV